MNKTIAFWIWKTQWDACEQCEALEGEHASMPKRPHPKCSCALHQARVEKAVLINESTAERRSGSRFEFLGHVQPNQDLNPAKTDEVGSSFSWNSPPFSSEISSARSWTDGRTFRYDPDIPGKIQEVWDVYAVYETTRTRTWKRADGTSFTEDEVTGSREEWQRSVWVEMGMPMGDGGAGEAETDDSDAGEAETDDSDAGDWGEETED